MKCSRPRILILVPQLKSLMPPNPRLNNSHLHPHPIFPSPFMATYLFRVLIICIWSPAGYHGVSSSIFSLHQSSNRLFVWCVSNTFSVIVTHTIMGASSHMQYIWCKFLSSLPNLFVNVNHVGLRESILYL